MGLAIRRDPARGMGGDLTAESTPEAGEHLHAHAGVSVSVKATAFTLQRLADLLTKG